MNLKLKRNKGITLIALIITIIVLLILAVVAIRAVQGDGILAHARNARDKWSEATANEEAMLGNLTNYITEQSGNNPNGGSGETYVKVTEGTTASDNGTINGAAPSADNPIIPKGFIPLDDPDGTSNWGDGSSAPDAQSVKNGLVITDNLTDGNEFVWIPVKNINDMVMCQEHGTATTLDETTLECPECKQATKLAGKLYAINTGENFSDSANASYDNWGLREPDILTDSTYGDAANQSQITGGWSNTLYQESFNAMVESVAKYKGFYVGRYEMSDKGGSKKDGTSLANTSADNNWYGLYSKAKTYAEADSSVTSEMIWGCQYDAMMRWMQDNGIDVTSETPKDTGRSNATTSKNGGNTTGNVDGDRLNNVYDLLGNRKEWTQEAYGTFRRASRGGDYDNSHSPSYRDYGGPIGTSSNGNLGSRLSLYVK